MCSLPASSNITYKESPGFIRKPDPQYIGLPAHSPKHPAPIDPAGKANNTHCLVETLADTNAYTVLKSFYISSGQV